MVHHFNMNDQKTFYSVDQVKNNQINPEQLIRVTSAFPSKHYSSFLDETFCQKMEIQNPKLYKLELAIRLLQESRTAIFQSWQREQLRTRKNQNTCKFLTWFLIKQAVFLQQPKNILIKFITIKFPTFQNFFIFQGLLHIIKIQKVFIPRINLRQPVFIFTLQNNYLYTQQPLFFFLQKIFISLTTILTLYFFFFFRKILVLFTNFFRTLFLSF